MHVIEIGNIYSRLVGERVRAVRAQLSFPAEGREFIESYRLYKKTGGMHGWDGLHYLLTEQGSFLTGLLPRVVALLGGEVSLVDKRPHIQATFHHTSVALRPYQTSSIVACFSNSTHGIWWPRGVVHQATGAGKCLGRGTKVLLYSGESCPVEDLKIGDLLMGPDSTPRRVRSVSRGYGRLVKIIPTRGDAWVCNEDHILTLRDTVTRKTTDLSVREWQSASVTKRHRLKQFRVGVSFSNRPVSVDPYFLGLWLGDGTKSLRTISITKPDIEVWKTICQVARQWGLRSTRRLYGSRCPTIVGNRGVSNPLLTTMRRLFAGGIDIPKEFRFNSESVRLELLAGLLDSDGYLGRGYFEFAQKNQKLADSACFVARSLGFRVVQREKVVNGARYASMSISGDVSRIPTRIPRKQAGPRRQKKDVQNVGIRILSAGEGDFFGFCLEGDGRFLLGDLTVTHNTEQAVAMHQILGARSVMLVQLRDLMYQTQERFAKYGERCGVVGDSEFDLQEVTVCTVQTISSILAPKEGGEHRHREELLNWARGVRQLFLDEAHLVSSKKLGAVNNACRLFDQAPFRWGLTATPFMRDEYANLLLEGTTGSTLSQASAKELVEQGYLVPPEILIYAVVDPTHGVPKKWPSCYNVGVVLNSFRNQKIAELALEFPKPCVILTSHVQHGLKLIEACQAWGLRGAFLWGQTKRRKGAIAMLRGGEIDVIIANRIFDIGIDIPEIRTIIVASGMRSKIASIQRLGRGLRRAADKDKVFILDFEDKMSPKLWEHSRDRLVAYRSLGFPVKGVEHQVH